MREARFERLTLILLGFAVAVAVSACHWPGLAARASFLDDDEYLLSNHLVQKPSLAGAWSYLAGVLGPSVPEYYHPLTMISLMLDSVRGGGPGNLRPYKETSLALHVCSCILMMFLIYQLFGSPWIATLVALMFGVHPIAVDRITWIADRKTVLSTSLALGCLVAYVRYVRVGSRGWYGLSLLLFVMALLAKPLTAVLPVMLILLDFWPLGRLNCNSLVGKIPFAILAILSVIATFISQARTVVLPTTGMAVTPLNILMVFCHNFIFYLCRCFFPASISIWDAFPRGGLLNDAWVRAGLLGTPIVLGLLLITLRWTRALVAGMMIYAVGICVSIVSVLHIGTVIAANRFAYFPMLGLALIVAWGMTRVGVRIPRDGAVRFAVVVPVILVIGLEVRLSREYLAHHADTEHFLRYTLARHPDDPTLLQCLGFALLDSRPGEAVGCFQRVLEQGPASPDPYANLSIALLANGDPAAAAAVCRQGLKSYPESAQLHVNYGTALHRLGEYKQAVMEYEKASQLDPAKGLAMANMGQAWEALGDQARAESAYREAIRREDSSLFRNSLGVLLLREGRLIEAAEHLERAVQLDDGYMRAQFNLGVVLLRMGRRAESMPYLREPSAWIPVSNLPWRSCWESTRRFPDLYLDRFICGTPMRPNPKAEFCPDAVKLSLENTGIFEILDLYSQVRVQKKHSSGIFCPEVASPPLSYCHEVGINLSRFLISPIKGQWFLLTQIALLRKLESSEKSERIFQQCLEPLGRSDINRTVSRESLFEVQPCHFSR